MNYKTTQKYLDLINGTKAWTEGEIRGVLKQFNSLRFSRYRNEVNARTEAIEGILETMERVDKVWPITKEQSSKGIAYLLKRHFKLNGEPRKSCPFNSRQQRIIKSFQRFAFAGVFVGNGSMGCNYYVPVYRVYAKNGDNFDYSPIHWGDPIVHDDLDDPKGWEFPVRKSPSKAQMRARKAKQTHGVPAVSAWPGLSLTLIKGGK